MSTKGRWNNKMARNLNKTVRGAAGLGLDISREPRALARQRSVLFMGMCLLLAAGCAQKLAPWVHALNLGPRQKVAAECTVPPGKVMILLDDDLDLVNPPIASQILIDELAEQMKEHQVAEQITTSEDLGRLRQSSPDFDKLSIREAGKLADADTVVWMNTLEFAIGDDLEMSTQPARFTIKLKVFDARAEEKEDLRLYPDQREGKVITAEVKAHDLHTCRTLKEAHEKLAIALAEEIAKLFYDHQVEE